MNRKSKFFLGSLVIVVAVAALIYTAARETSAYFLTMDEYAADAAAHSGKPLRLAGRVSDGSIRWDPKTLDLEFAMQPIPPNKAKGAEAVAAEVAPPPPPGAILAVKYNGILPDMFAEGRDVIVEGRVTNQVFEADTLLTTCPSKYEAEQTDPTQAGAEPERSAELAAG